MKLSVTLWGSLLCGIVALGCASNPPLRTESSTSAIRAAEAVGAEALPRASLHLQLAKEELARAEELASNGEGDKATSLLQRAEVDAELAVLLSREETQKLEAAEAMKRVRVLQRDNR